MLINFITANTRKVILSLFFIYYIFLLSLFGGVIPILGIPEYFVVTVELVIILLFLLSLITSRGAKVPHLWYSFSLFASRE